MLILIHLRKLVTQMLLTIEAWKCGSFMPIVFFSVMFYNYFNGFLCLTLSPTNLGHI